MMKVHTLEAMPADAHFPVTHTCFFSIEWPRYSSVVLRARNCSTPSCTAPTWTWIPPPKACAIATKASRTLKTNSCLETEVCTAHDYACIL